MSDGPYKMGTIARLSGFSPELLRAWERRYALVEPSRGPGGQRLYSDDDLRVLRHVRVLLDEGRSIGEIAQLGRERVLRNGRRLDRTSVDTQASGGRGAGGAGGNGLASAAADWRSRILDAALGMNSVTLSATLDEAFALAGAERTIHDVIEPSAREIGDLWAAERCSVASEHLASDQFTHRVHRMVDEAQPTSADAPRLVAACFPDEHHQLGLLVLAWHLARRGFRVDYLGTSFPLSNLEQACRAAAPEAVLLSVTRKTTYRRHRDELSAVISRRSFRWSVYVGGQGVVDSGNGLPRARAHVVNADADLHEVVDTIAGVMA